ncbi:MAG TPA: tRNA (adenosine(37)-N6)-threonylcarbamoyltransferase complex transferase subunit TsaD, partial [Paracoccaceae bacterium]|nr:tRNA (adenosine(37)-N6)-threonylcarbamoyltransferase complex transferase subunit TsaD [Paracoccaceae bacterium]
FPRPLIEREDCDLSFSGLKTAVLRARDALIAEQGGLWRRDVADLSASFEAAVADVLAAKTARALRRFASLYGAGQGFAVAGGVAANSRLRAALGAAANEASVTLTAPPLALCTDNGAMIAWAGIERLAAGIAPEPVNARPRWPLDLDAAPMLGAGKRGAKA